MFIGTVIAIVAATVGMGIWLAGAPSAERSRKLDDQRSNGLQQITAAAQEFFRVNGEAPASLQALNDRTPGVVPVDPATGAAYEYSSSGKNAFTLCAAFDSANDGHDFVGRAAPAPVAPTDPWGFAPEELPNFFVHGAGRTCFNAHLAPLPPASNCQLMREQKTGQLDCFGCSGKVCKDPATSWSPYVFSKTYSGVPYACAAGPSGCMLVQ